MSVPLQVEMRTSDRSNEVDTKHLTNTIVNDVSEEAKMATSKEHGMTVRQGLKAYRKAIGWSILLSSAVIMEGYDTILVSLTSPHYTGETEVYN